MQSSRSGQATSSAKMLNSVSQPSTKQFNVGASDPLKRVDKPKPCIGSSSSGTRSASVWS
eukprot:2908599-Pyramimonas_sp.AAC.1